MDRVVITRPMVGICFMQVCCVKDATNEEILKVCDERNPAGTQLGWALVLREEVCDGSFGREPHKAPVPCDEHPDRLHILVAC